MDPLLSFWTASENLPFSAALMLMLMLMLIQLLGLSDLIHHEFDMDGDAGVGAADGLLSIIGLGRLPFLIWLVLFLALFGVIGHSGQQLMAVLTGGRLSPWIATPLVALATLPLTGLLARPLARILPHDETTPIPIASLQGLPATITVGRAMRGSPARARVIDFHGQQHHVMVEPDNDGQSFAEGETVRLVRLEGQAWRAIGDGAALLPRLDG